MKIGYIYCITYPSCSLKNKFKIGLTQNIDKIFNRYSTHNPETPQLLFTKEVWDIKNAEKMIKFELRDKKIKGEWYAAKKEDIENVFEEVSRYYPSLSVFLDYLSKQDDFISRINDINKCNKN